MSISTSNQEGRYEVAFRRDGGFRAAAATLVGVVGVGLCLAPILISPPSGPEHIAGSVLLFLLVALGVLKLVSEASRARRIRSSLHLASGEMEVKSGTAPLGRTRAFGAVEVDRFLLSRENAAEPARFSASVVPTHGPPILFIDRDEDEGAVRDAALMFAQGMGVPLEDRRYNVSLDAQGAGPQAPSRVAAFEEGPRVVFSWNYRDRLRPNLSLLGLGVLTFTAFGLPSLVSMPLPLVLASSLLMVILALAILAHSLRSLAVRRVTLRPDAVRAERFFAGIPLLSRLALFREMEAILLLRRGPFASVVLRSEGRRTSVSLPFEDPRVAGWISGRIHRAAHDAIRAERAGAREGDA